MKTNIPTRNMELLLEKKKREQMIHLILEELDLRTQVAIVEELKQRNIKTTQPTVYRDLSRLEIKKNADGYFKPTNEVQKKVHLDALYDLLITNKSSICNNVKTYFIKTKEGKAQEIAFHLEQFFSGIVLKTVIDLDNLLVFADGDSISEEFIEFFQIID